MVFLKIARWSILHCLLLFFLQNYFFKLTLLNHCHHIKCFLYFNYCLTSKPSGAGQGWLCGGLRSDCRAANRRCRGSIRRARVALSQRSGCQETRVVECKLMKCACLLLVHMGVWVCVHGAKYDAPASRLLGVTHLRLFFSVCACMDAHVRVCCVSLLQAYVWLCLHMCACVCVFVCGVRESVVWCDYIMHQDIKSVCLLWGFAFLCRQKWTRSCVRFSTSLSPVRANAHRRAWWAPLPLLCRLISTHTHPHKPYSST